MSRATLSLWGSRPADDWSAPERKVASSGRFDRLLAGLGACLALRCDGLERHRLRLFAKDAARLAEPLAALDDDKLKAEAAKLHLQLLRQGVTQALATRAFALGSEASARLLGMRPYPVQLMGGYGLLRGRLIEMATGEGKTLTAMLPSLTLAMAGIPVHVVTVNDYLARRDAEYVRPVLDLFGFRVGVVTHAEDDKAKREAYRCDVTYCVNKDLVFDYLRDRLKSHGGGAVSRSDGLCQRGLYFALVDEADSTLVDEARTPLVIARERSAEDQQADAELALHLAHSLQPGHYCAEQQGRHFRLTNEGRFFLGIQEHLLAPAPQIWRIARYREEKVEQALSALHAFHRGTNYVVHEGKVQIVDEFTGRILPDRSWERGLHQMIEVKEGADLTAPRDTLARQTYPGYFARYLRIAGMSGTASEVAGEMMANYGMRTVRIPGNRPVIRRFLGTRCFLRSSDRWRDIAERAVALANQGRAVLIGTRSVAASEAMSRALAHLGQPHRVLNALQDGDEAGIVAQAGQPSCVTVATNMAGRGTDIHLHPDVRSAGGLHVILSEFHESRRIDRQLYGRTGRQGDPGSCEAMVSLEDDLFTRFSPRLVRWLEAKYRGRGEVPMPWGQLLRLYSQQRAERTNASVRRTALERDTALRRTLSFSGAEE